MPPRRAKAAAAKKLAPAKTTPKKATAVEEKPEEEPEEAPVEPEEPVDVKPPKDLPAEEEMEAEEAGGEAANENGDGDAEVLAGGEELGDEDLGDVNDELLDEEHEEEVGSEEDEEYEVIDEDVTGEDSSPKKRKPVGEGGLEAKRKKSDAEEEEPQHEESNMLGVRPLPEEITEEELKGIFDTAMSVKLSRQSYSDGKRGYVEFKTVEEAKTVMESKQGAEFMGKKLELRFVYPQSEVRYKLYVGNLPWNATESDLQSLFTGAKTIRIIKNKADKGLWVPIRYALLTYVTEEEVKNLVEEKQNEPLKGHSLELMEENKQRLDYDLQEVLRYEVNERTLVVQGLAPNATKEDLDKLFPGSLQWRIPRKMGSARNQGVAELEFPTREEVATMVEEKQGTELMGHSLWLCNRADIINGFKIGETNKLTVSGFPSDTEADYLKKAFDGVTKAILMSSGSDHHLNSCAAVEFESNEAAKNAYEKKQGMKVRGRSVTLYNWGPATKVRRYTQPYDTTNRLLLRDVPKDATEEAIKEKFETSTKAVIIKDYRTEEPRGIAYVEFENRDVAGTAFETIKEIELGETSVPVEMVLKPRENIPLKYFLKNMPDTVTEDALKEYFTGVEEVEIQGITVKSEKYGTIKFNTSDDAREAYKKKDNLEIDGHKFIIEYIKSDRPFRSGPRGRIRSSYGDRGSSRGRGRGRGFGSRGRDFGGRGGYDSRRGYNSRGRGGYDSGYESRGRGRNWGSGNFAGRDYDSYRGRDNFRRDRDQYRDKEYREMEDYYKRREEYWRKDDYGGMDDYHRRDAYSGRDTYNAYGARGDTRMGREDYGGTSRDGYWGRDDYSNREGYDNRRQNYGNTGNFASRGRDDGFRRDKFGRRDDYGASGVKQNRFGDRDSYSNRGGGRGAYRGRGRGGGGFY